MKIVQDSETNGISVKKHQIITLLFFAWALAISLQIQKKIQKHAITALEAYWDHPWKIMNETGSGEACPETTSSTEPVMVVFCTNVVKGIFP